MQKKGRSLSETPNLQGVSLAKVTGLLWDIPASHPRAVVGPASAGKSPAQSLMSGCQENRLPS
jgi:hypothetical protein